MPPRQRVVTAWRQLLQRGTNRAAGPQLQQQCGCRPPALATNTSCAFAISSSSSNSISSSITNTNATNVRQLRAAAMARLGCWGSRGFAAAGGGAQGQARSAGARAGQAAATKPIAVGARGTKAAAAASSVGSSTSGFSRWWQSFQTVPAVPKWLGLTGAIPFIALAPPVCKHLTGLLPADVVDNCATIQVCYGAIIVTFLGAVHWGVAMASPLAASAAGARITNDAFVYSVLPSLLAWPVTLMEPGVGSIALSILLPACYMADHSRRNLGLPAWYMALRVPLTLLATFGMLLTATRAMHQELDRVNSLAAAEPVAAGQGAVQGTVGNAGKAA